MAYQPTIEDHPLKVVRYHQRKSFGIKIIVVHIQDGTNWGSWDWWHHVTASSTVLISRKGVIWRVVPEHLAPWTNGDVQNPSPEMIAVMNKWGWDPNTYSLTIELEGYVSAVNPMGWYVGFTPEQKAAMEWQIQTWQDKYNIPDDMVFMHSKINSVTRANCIPKFMWDQVQAFIKNSPVTPPSPYASPMKIAGFDGTKDVVINKTKFFADRRTATVSAKSLHNHLYASRTSAITAPPMDEGTSFEVLGWVEGEQVNGERRWWIKDDFSRVHVGGTHEKPRKDPEGKPDYVPRMPVIHDGRVYHRIGDFNDHWEEGRRTKVVVSKANVREDATLDSDVLGVVTRGTELNVKYFTIGDEVRGENLWYVLHDRRGSLEYGARLWVGATDLRPR